MRKQLQIKAFNIITEINNKIRSAFSELGTTLPTVILKILL